MIVAGGKEGQGDAANLLKPALASGELRTIAATTWAEYKKYFERDPALTRRFQMVKIEEPSEEKAINMMRAISEMLQNHHRVRIIDEAIVDSVRLSSRYITARQLPDKSVSLLDTACARVSLSQSATPAAIEDTCRLITQCETNIHSLERENAALDNCADTIAELVEKQTALEKKLATQEEQWQKELALVAQIHELQQQIEDDFQASRNPTQKDEPKETLSEEQSQEIRSNLQALLAELDELQGDDPLIQV